MMNWQEEQELKEIKRALEMTNGALIELGRRYNELDIEHRILKAIHEGVVGEITRDALKARICSFAINVR